MNYEIRNTKYEGEMGAVGGASRTGREWEGVSRRCSEGLGGVEN